mmetsp:Transcript_5348/g.12892  ORF Transcript_5348/g.12892 Transcript_5348/m.12892 type:complete len:815 (-) Transcript_5348:138-2582(-)
MAQFPPQPLDDADDLEADLKKKRLEEIIEARLANWGAVSAVTPPSSRPGTRQDALRTDLNKLAPSTGFRMLPHEPHIPGTTISDPLRSTAASNSREQTCQALLRSSYSGSPWLMKDEEHGYETSSTTDEDDTAAEAMLPMPTEPACKRSRGWTESVPEARVSITRRVSSEAAQSSVKPSRATEALSTVPSRRSKVKHPWDLREPQVEVSHLVAQCVCEQYEKNFVSRPPGLLQRDLNTYWDKTASLSSALFTSAPLTVAMTKTVWQLLVLFAGVAVLAAFTYLCVEVSQNGTEKALQGRLVAESLQSSGVVRLEFGYSGFALTSTQWQNVTETAHEREFAVTFPQPLNINEVWIVADGNGPTAYRVEIRSARTELSVVEEAQQRAEGIDAGQAWETWVCCGDGEYGCLGGGVDSKLLATRSGECVLSQQFQENYFNQRFTVQKSGPLSRYGLSLSAGANWNRHFKEMAPLLAAGAFFMAVPFFGEMRWHRMTKWSGAAVAFIMALVQFVILAIGFYGDYQVWLHLFVSLATAICILFKQRHIVMVFFGPHGTYFIIVGLDSLTRQDSSGYAWLCLGATCAGILLVAEVVKHRTVTRAKALIAEDVKSYQALWRDVCKNPEVVDVLNSLVVLCTNKNGWEKDIRQRDEKRRPLTDLSQIFAQAWAVDPELGRKIVEWAHEVGARRHVQHAKVKSADRAIQKVHRSYAGDPSRLLDLTRRTIILKTIEAIMTCVTIIRKDPEVKVLRIKNRLAPGSYVDTGYRDVNISLQVQTDDTKALGAHLHVCEVQLILQDFYELKTSKGHKAYVEFRNLTGT